MGIISPEITPQSNSTENLDAGIKYFPPSWSGYVLRKRYTDPMKLKIALDEIYGPGKYRVVVCS